MGYGDNIMATGFARGAADRGKIIAFGDGKRIRWDQNSAAIFDRNPNIARPGCETRSDIEWFQFYKGHRLYNTQGNGRWIWNYAFRAKPGEMFFSDAERKAAEQYRPGFILIEPNVPTWKTVAPNKQWPFDRYNEVARTLKRQGHRVAQFAYKVGNTLDVAEQIATRDFRSALAVLRRAALYIGPEGGLHHGSAAVGTKAVVMFGGFIPPQVTGYDTHINLTGGAEACGMFTPCQHCRDAMNRIGVDEVLAAAHQQLQGASVA